MSGEMAVWSVTWAEVGRAKPPLIDLYDEGQAFRCSSWLAAHEKTGVEVIEQRIDVSPAEEEKLADVRERVWARIAAQRVEENVRLKLAMDAKCQACDLRAFIGEVVKEAAG